MEFIEVFPEVKDVQMTSKGSFNFFHEEEHVKISYFSKDIYSNNFIVEAEIFEHVLSDLKKHTPNIVSWKRTLYGVLPENFTDSKKIVVKDFDEDFDKTKCMAVVTEKIVGSTTENYDPCIMAQIMYTLLCFERIGLTHNDLHQGNILVTTLDKPVNFYYKVGDKNIVMKTNKKVTIIDFDLASIYHDQVQRNHNLDLIEDHGPGLVRGRDLHRIAQLKFVKYPFFSTCLPKLYLLCESMSNQKYSVYLHLDEFFGRVEECLLRLVDFYDDFFTDQIAEGMVCYSPPEDCAVRFRGKNPCVKSYEIAHACPFPVTKKRLMMCGYDWHAHAFELYQRLRDKFPMADFWWACLYVTNPYNEDCPDKTDTIAEIVDEILTCYTPVFEIPQKLTDPNVLPKFARKKEKYNTFAENIKNNSFTKSERDAFLDIPEDIRTSFTECGVEEISGCFIVVQKMLEDLRMNVNFVKYTGKTKEVSANISNLLKLFESVNKKRKIILLACVVYIARKTMLRHMNPSFAKVTYKKCVEFETDVPWIMKVLKGQVKNTEEIIKIFLDE